MNYNNQKVRCFETLTISPVIMHVIVSVLRSTRQYVTQYGDGNSRNNSNYTSEHVLIFAITYLTALSVVRTVYWSAENHGNYCS